MTFHSSEYVIPTKLSKGYENGYLRSLIVEPRYYVLNQGDGTKFDHPDDAIDWFKNTTVGELIEDGWTEFKDEVIGVYDCGETVHITDIEWKKNDD